MLIQGRPLNSLQVLRVGNLSRGLLQVKSEPSFAGLGPGWAWQQFEPRWCQFQGCLPGAGLALPSKSPESVLEKMLSEAKQSHQSVGDEMCASADAYAEMQKSFVHIMKADKYAEMCIYTSRSPPQCKMLTLE